MEESQEPRACGGGIQDFKWWFALENPNVSPQKKEEEDVTGHLQNVFLPGGWSQSQGEELKQLVSDTEGLLWTWFMQSYSGRVQQ